LKKEKFEKSFFCPRIQPEVGQRPKNGHLSALGLKRCCIYVGFFPQLSNLGRSGKVISFGNNNLKLVF